VASNRTGARRLLAISEKYGLEVTRDYMRNLQHYAERMTREAISAIPDGTYRFEDVLDDDGLGSGPLPIVVAITIDGDHARVDFTGTSPQTAGSINAIYAITLSAVMYCFRIIVPFASPSNYGTIQPLEVIAPDGSLVNARLPAAVAGGNVETSQRIVDVVRVRPILDLAQRLGTLGAAIAGGPIKSIEVRYSGSHPSGLRVITAAAVAGALTHVSGGAVNVVNATRLAQSRSIRVNQMQQEIHAPYGELVEVRVASDAGAARVSGALLGDTHERIVRVDDYEVSVTPRGTLLVLRNSDAPQVMGLVAGALAKAGHFVDEYQQARRNAVGDVLSLIRIDRPAADGLVAEIRSIPDVRQVQQVLL
jgi:hypothetical protein